MLKYGRWGLMSLIILFSLSVHFPGESHRLENNLDFFIKIQLEKAKMPGLSAALVKHGKIVWTGSYGWARLKDQQVTSETIFQLASVSKTITAVAVMMVQEEGLLDLDRDINDYLPFKVINPGYAQTPITARMLLTHTSSIQDDWDTLNSAYKWGTDHHLSLKDFLQQYFSSAGGKFTPQQSFSPVKPGAAYHYSNIGTALAALLVEAIMELPFDQFCQQRIFKPLTMKETSWHLADFKPAHLAMPYNCQESFRPYGFYSYPDYPDGLLKTSAPQLARFLAMFIQEGELEGVRILQRKTVQEMCRIQNPQLDSCQGLLWHYKKLSGWELCGHSGEDMGVASEMFFRPEDGVGVILLMNGEWTEKNEPLIMEIEARLLAEAQRL